MSQSAAPSSRNALRRGVGATFVEVELGARFEERELGVRRLLRSVELLDALAHRRELDAGTRGTHVGGELALHVTERRVMSREREQQRAALGGGRARGDPSLDDARAERAVLGGVGHLLDRGAKRRDGADRGRRARARRAWRRASRRARRACVARARGAPP